LCAGPLFSTVASNSRIAALAKGEVMNMPKVVSRLALGLLTGASLLAIGGCSLFEGKKPDQPQCPRISVLADAYRETRFQAGKGHDLTDVELEAQVSNFKGSTSTSAS